VFHFFSAAAVWARAILDDPSGPFAGPARDPPHVIVLGNTDLGRAVTVGAARRWHEHVRDHGASGRATIALCGGGAPAACAAVVERLAAVPRVCDLEGIEYEPEAAFPRELADRTASAGPAVVYVCVDDPGDRLAAAFDAVHHLDRDIPILVPTVAAAAVVTPLQSAEQIHVVDLSRVDSVDLIHDHMRDRFARESHAVWLEQRRKTADFGSQSSDRPWEELADDYRRASYAHIQGMSEQLQAVWYEIGPLEDWDEPPEELPAPVVEAMAELEHARWCRERRADGWRPGPERNDRRRIHPLLVPWSELSEEKRSLDRELVRCRPTMLARAGYRLSRSPVRERLARIVHERYRARQAAGGVDVAPWRELDAPSVDANLAAVDHIAVKLARIGCRAVPQVPGLSLPSALNEREIEQLAELEHERWTNDQEEAGRIHPSMIPWHELDEPEREKDRDVVRAIPELLATAGLTIVRDND
jgi:hypothetical protein